MTLLFISDIWHFQPVASAIFFWSSPFFTGGDRYLSVKLHWAWYFERSNLLKALHIMARGVSLLLPGYLGNETSYVLGGNDPSGRADRLIYHGSQKINYSSFYSLSPMVMQLFVSFFNSKRTRGQPGDWTFPKLAFFFYGFYSSLRHWNILCTLAQPEAWFAYYMVGSNWKREIGCRCLSETQGTLVTNHWSDDDTCSGGTLVPTRTTNVFSRDTTRLVGQGNAWHFHPDSSSYSCSVFDGSAPVKKSWVN